MYICIYVYIYIIICKHTQIHTYASTYVWSFASIQTWQNHRRSWLCIQGVHGHAAKETVTPCARMINGFAMKWQRRRMDTVRWVCHLVGDSARIVQIVLDEFVNSHNLELSRLMNYHNSARFLNTWMMIFFQCHSQTISNNFHNWEFDVEFFTFPFFRKSTVAQHLQHHLPSGNLT